MPGDAACTTARIPFVFDVAAARRLLDAAAALPDNPRARQRGPTYRAIFALCYGLGLRAGEACGLRLGDVDPRRRSPGGAGRQVRQEPARPARPAHRRADRRAARTPPRRRRGVRRRPAVQLRRPPLRAPGHRQPGVPSAGDRARFHCPRRVFRRRGCTDLDTRSRSGACCAGIATGWTHRPGCSTLATFLGHVDPASTAVYLTITPGLLGQANQRFEAFAEPAWREAAR